MTAVERADDDGDLDAVSVLPDPNVGALTQIFREYAPPDVPVIIENVVTDIDTIVRQVRFTGWTQTQNGDRTVRREIRLVLKKYGLPVDRRALRPRVRLYPGELLRRAPDTVPRRSRQRRRASFPISSSTP